MQLVKLALMVRIYQSGGTKSELEISDDMEVLVPRTADLRLRDSLVVSFDRLSPWSRDRCP